MNEDPCDLSALRQDHDAHDQRDGLAHCPGWMADDGTRPEPPPQISEDEQLRDRLWTAETTLSRIREAIATDQPADARRDPTADEPTPTSWSTIAAMRAWHRERGLTVVGYRQVTRDQSGADVRYVPTTTTWTWEPPGSIDQPADAEAEPIRDHLHALRAERDTLRRRLDLAHQTRRAKEHQLDGIRRALCDTGAMRDDDPYSHADLEDVIRQAHQADTEADFGVVIDDSPRPSTDDDPAPTDPVTLDTALANAVRLLRNAEMETNPPRHGAPGAPRRLVDRHRSRRHPTGVLMSRDRTTNYQPDSLRLDGPPRRTEISGPHGERPPRTGRIALGHADELNREHDWWWADTSGDGTHWSHFNGHHVQIDIELHTANRREVNDWKGRDEIRAEGTWTLALNRQQIWEGFLRADPLDQLIDIRRIALKLIQHDAIDWATATPAAEQLLGRRVYYDRTPAVISSVSVLDQGCVILRPVGVDTFPPAVYFLDHEGDDDPYERQEIKTELLDPKVWWWRSRPAGDEPRPEPAVEVPGKPLPGEPEADHA